MTFDRILTSTPINRAAGLALSRGIGWEPEKSQGDHVFRSDVRPQCLPYAGTADLTGQVFGRLTVIGFAGDGSGGMTRWYVRCTCGSYERRRGKSLRLNKGSQATMCSACDHLEEVKRGNYLPKHLREPAA